jgi:thiol-disulfide isomerase/thioredoxin
MPRALSLAACVLTFSALCSPSRAQNSSPAKSQGKAAPESASKKEANPDAELEKALASAGNDRAALVRNLKTYLLEYPDAPRKASVFRALVEACQHLRDNVCALEYAERLIAIQPDDSEMMLLAVSLLQQQGDDASLVRADGYVTRVLDRVEKSTPEERSAHASEADWQERHDKIRAALYFLRGEIESSLRNYDAAKKDLQTSYSIRPNAAAAEVLGEIAELQKDLPKAIEEYTLAFVLPDSGPSARVDRRLVRKKLGNVWRQAHVTEKGLGDAILAAYDRVEATATGTSAAAARNKGAKEFFDFTLRNEDGTPEPLATLRGKILALSFWATWCGPCRELEPIFSQVAKSYVGNSEIVFLAVNTDEDESLVPPFLAKERWSVASVYADGLDDFLKIESLPTVMLFDRSGKIVYHSAGFVPEKFASSLTTAIQNALATPK